MVHLRAFGLGLVFLGLALEVRAAELPILDGMLHSWNLQRSTEADHLRLEAGEWLAGTFVVQGLKLDEQPFEAEKVAAIMSRPGSRQARLFLRDGSVKVGPLTWTSATFESTSLGSVVLSPESPGQIVLRQKDHDGQMKAPAMAWRAESAEGRIEPLHQMPEQPLLCQWLGGEWRIPWNEVADFRALTAPSLEHEVRLQDGSRIQGWLNLPWECSAWARSLPDLMALLSGKMEVSKPLDGSSLSFRNGDALKGGFASKTLTWSTANRRIEVKTADISSIRRLSAQENLGLPIFEIQTRQGATWVGRPALTRFDWQRGSQKLPIPWAELAQLTVNSSGERRQP